MILYNMIHQSNLLRKSCAYNDECQDKQLVKNTKMKMMYLLLYQNNWNTETGPNFETAMCPNFPFVSVMTTESCSHSASNSY